MLQTIGRDEFLENHILTNLKVHPKGKFGLYIDNTLDYEANLYREEIYLLNLESLTSKPLKLSIRPEDYYFNEEYVIFKMFTDDKTAFYSYDVETEELVKICEIPLVAIDVGFSDCIYFTAHVQNDDTSNGVFSSNNSPFYEEGYGFVGQKVKGLFASDYRGKEISVLTHMGMDIDLLDFDFSHDRIIFTAFESKAIKPVFSDVFVYDIHLEQLHRLTKSHYRIDGLKSICLTKVVFAGVDVNEKNRNDNQQIFTIDLKTMGIEPLGSFVDMSNERPGVVTDAIFAKGNAEQCFDGKYYHLRLDEYRQLLTSINIQGEMEFIQTGMTTISNYCVLKDQIILLGMKDQQLSEIYSFAEGKLTQITDHNSWLDSYKVSRAESFSVKAGDVHVNGWVFPSVKEETVENYPGILMIHGGPKMVYSDVFSFDIQMLCAEGYYVFIANPMGSDGRGDAYANIRNSFAELPYSQLMLFTDGVLKSYPMIDKERLGVTGGSYGGYMTNYIITKTNRFKVAISERGISSMVTMLTSSDIGYAFAVEYTMNKENPWLHLDKYMSLSPIMAAKEIRTPTLFNHGINDYRCHFTESLNMHSALCQLGIPSRLCLYEEENHSLAVKGKPKSKQRRFLENLSWYEKYLMRG